MSLATIRGKLIVLLAVLVVGFGALGYEIIKLSNDGKRVADRVLAVSQINSELVTSIAELRAYFLQAQESRLTAFQKHFKNTTQQIDAFIADSRGKNKEKIVAVKNSHQEWEKVTVPLAKMTQTYGAAVNQKSFAKEYPDEFKETMTLRKASSQKYEITKQLLEELLKDVTASNFKRLDDEKLYAEITILVVSIIVLIVFFLITGSIKSSVAKGKEGCELIRSSKDLSMEIETGTKDEINDIVQAVNNVMREVGRAIGEAKGNAIENASVAEELSSTSLQIGKRAEEESSVVAQATHDASVVATEIHDSSTQAQIVKTVTLQAQKSLAVAQSLLEETIGQLQQTAQAEAHINDRLNHLASEAQQVRSVLDVIGDIADQTNLLALNAAIEAARAGEHGRGFAVVADEVRKLAERTQKSLIETNATINVIVQSIGDISGEMNINAKRVDGVSEFSDKVSLQTKDAVSILAQSVEASDIVVAKANSNIQLIESAVIKKIGAINELSSSNARSVEEIASAAEHLSKLAGTLSNTLSEFKTA